MKQYSRIAIGAIAALVIFSLATAEAARKPKDILQYIPADTPYVAAFTKPLPDDLADKLEPAIDKTLSAYQTIIRFKLEESTAALSGEEGGAEKAAQMEAFVAEFVDLLSIKGLRDAGIGRDSIFAIYGDGLLPVFRLGLTDRDAFEATITRIESKAAEKFKVGELDGQSYRYHDIDKVKFVIATPGKDAVITVVPVSYSDERLAQALGFKKPRNSLARSKDLRKIRKEYDFTDHVVSFVDVERIAAAFTGDASGRNAELFAIAGYDASGIDEICRNEIAELAAIAPRIVMGYTNIGKKRIDAEMIVELRDDIASGLATLPAAVPGLGTDLGGLFTFGFSFDPLAARTFYEERLDAMESDPFKCEHLADLQASTAKGREALAQPLPPVVYSFRGILANVSNITGLDLESKKPPESIDASILFAIENAQDLVAMGALMSPDIAALNLLPDGKAKALELPQLAEIAEQAFAALSAKGLSVSLGEGSDQKVESMLAAKVDSSNPLMTMSMDAQSYYGFVGDAVMQADEGDEGEANPVEVRTAVRDIMQASAEVYERMSVNVHLTERGIEVGSRITLAD